MVRISGVFEAQNGATGDFAKFPVVLVDSTDLKTPETGVAYTDVTCKYRKANASSLTEYSLSGKWTEIGEGVYVIDFAAILDENGPFIYVVYGAGYVHHYGLVMVTAHKPHLAISGLTTNVGQLLYVHDIYIDHPEEIKIPDGQSALDGELAASATSVEFDDASLFPAKGYFKCESEWIYYGAKSANTLSSLVRAQFGTGDATHADATAVYQGIPQKTILTIHSEGLPKAPNTTPQITIKTIGGTTIQSQTNMTQEGAKVGIYYFDLLFASDQTIPDAWVLMYNVDVVVGKTSEYRKMSLLVGEASTQGDVMSGLTPTSGLRQVTQDGYLDGTGTWNAWTDDELGAMTDAQGDFVFRGVVVWQHIVGGLVKRQVNPPSSTYTEADGEWCVYLAPGTYNVHFWKDGIKDVEVERTVT